MTNLSQPEPSDTAKYLNHENPFIAAMARGIKVKPGQHGTVKALAKILRTTEEEIEARIRSASPER